jgi:hypothetical protein
MNLTKYILSNGQTKMMLIIVFDKLGVSVYERPSIYISEAKKWYSHDSY